MEITLIKNNATKETVPGVKPLTERSQIGSALRVFYEAGHKKDPNLGVDGGNWVRTGEFIEIEDPLNFMKKDDRLDDPAYIKHHNFVFLEKTNFKTI